MESSVPEKRTCPSTDDEWSDEKNFGLFRGLLFGGAISLPVWIALTVAVSH